ncbi:MAG TPA: response regulator transcription factor [Erysipelotrichaceae bacterium]|nr:response regulator transcription factor [Erysipelotrichaceae bacterium]
MESRTILIVEDELKLVEILKVNFEHQGFNVFTTHDGVSAVELAKDLPISLVLLDLMIPKLSGEQVCQTIRQFSRMPIIMLTARTSEENIVDGLKLGADDYITKPFSLKELNARVETVLRRSETSVLPLFQTMKFEGGLEIDLNKQSVSKHNISIHLTPNEFKILSVLIHHPTRVFTREQLVEFAFGSDFDGYDRTVDTHIKNLRNKIEDNPKVPIYIQTVFGLGYRFGTQK